MLKSLFWAAWLFAFIIGRLPAYLRAKRLLRQGRTQEAQAVVDRQIYLWTSRLMKHIKMDVTIEGSENLPPKGQPAIFVCNHQSYLDIVILLSDLNGPHGFMAKESLAKIPFLGGWVRLIGCVLVEREDIRAAAAAMRAAEEHVEAGRSLIIFPEGTRSMSDEMGEFKGGAVRIALKTGAPIVPVAIDGAWKALEGNRYRVQPTQPRMVILPMIETKDLDRAAQKALPAQLEALIRAAKDDRPALPEGEA